VGIFGVYRAALHGKQLLSERRSKNGSGSIETNKVTISSSKNNNNNNNNRETEKTCKREDCQRQSVHKLLTETCSYEILACRCANVYFPSS
jgi:hypothetical protein